MASRTPPRWLLCALAAIFFALAALFVFAAADAPLIVWGPAIRGVDTASADAPSDQLRRQFADAGQRGVAVAFLVPRMDVQQFMRLVGAHELSPTGGSFTKLREWSVHGKQGLLVDSVTSLVELLRASIHDLRVLDAGDALSTLSAARSGHFVVLLSSDDHSANDQLVASVLSQLHASGVEHSAFFTSNAVSKNHQIRSALVDARAVPNLSATATTPYCCGGYCKGVNATHNDVWMCSNGLNGLMVSVLLFIFVIIGILCLCGIETQERFFEEESTDKKIH